MNRETVQRVAGVASLILIAGLWIPWGKLSIGLLGGAPGGLGTINGQEMGSEVLDLPVGWICAAGGALALIGILDGSLSIVRIGGIIGLLVTGYAAIAIPGKEFTTAANGQDISDIINGQVDYAWGLYVLVAASLCLVIAPTVIHQPAEEAVDDELVAREDEHGTSPGAADGPNPS
jgi:hypothetical protein